MISPTGKCNLRCKACYAADAALHGRQLSFEVMDRILREKRELWGSHWTVISGGEPFLWHDGEWDIIGLARRHPSDVFMVYTNGTLIDDELAARMADAGNISPAISVEGLRDETDGRRGEGVHAKILASFDTLRGHGVPFGISATATEITGAGLPATSSWTSIFWTRAHYTVGFFSICPWAAKQTLDLVVPPELRVEMAQRMWRLVRLKKAFLIDFWNSATVSQGCISSGRPGGYFHINWDGDIMPCVFTPYAADNILDIYARGEDLSAAIESPFFRKIREWQSEYGFRKAAPQTGNWLCPCAIRDHFDAFLEAVRTCGARPINPEAQEAISNPLYCQGMLDYGDEMAKLTEDNCSASTFGRIRLRTRRLHVKGWQFFCV